MLGETVRRTAEQRTTSTGDLGADLKYSVTPSLTLDMTYNTDFAQVEVDQQQINLDRFNLFFPEKRSFFLENAGLFSVGQPGQVEIFFSRRIGIGAGGEQIPILGGGRLSGKIGNNTNVGFLRMQTESVDATGTASQNFTVARVRQDFASPGRTSAPSWSTGKRPAAWRATETPTAPLPWTAGWGSAQGGTITGFAAETDTPGEASLDTHAYGLSASHESERARLTLGYSEVGSNFNPEVGFYQRRGYRRMNASVFTFFRPEDFMGLHELRPHAAHNTVWDFETGLHETQFTHIDTHWEWENGHEIHTGMNISKEGVFRAVPRSSRASSSRPGVYDDMEAKLVAQTNRGATVPLNPSTATSGASSVGTACASARPSRCVSARRSTRSCCGTGTTSTCPVARSSPTWGASGCRIPSRPVCSSRPWFSTNDRGRPLVVERALRAAVRREHRALHRLQ